LSTNLPTDALISAILTQESQPMLRMEAKETANNAKTAALTTLKTDLTSLNLTMSSLVQSGFQNRTVTSSDTSTSPSVTATATGAATGVYDLTVKKLATRARMTLPPAPAVPSVPPVPLGVPPAASIGAGTYTIKDMDGTSVDLTVGAAQGNDSLVGLRDAINSAKDSSGNALNVNATIIQTGTDGTSQLVLSANNTGLGKNGAATFSLTGPATNTLGLGTTATDAQTAATNAQFTLNGVNLERTSNAVTDAVDGVTFNLQAEDAGKTTSLTVGVDKAAVTTAMQAVVTKYNAFYSDYKAGTSPTTDASGVATNGVFQNDSAIRGMIDQVHQAIMGAPTGLSATADFNGAASVGLKTNRDGTLSLDTTAFSAALDKNANGVANVFNNSGTSTSPLLSFLGATGATTTKPITFSLGQADAQGVVIGTFTSTDANNASVTNQIQSSTGYFYGATGSPFEGLTVKASAGATGTLQVSKGVAQNTSDLIQSLTSLTAGNLGSILQNITTENSNLTTQISSQQERLDRRKVNLQNLYANLETTIGQLQAAGQSISSM
jgi:flagellar hook-associated protein 2